MGNSVSLSNMHCAADPVMFHSDDPKRLHARVTGMQNVYKDRNGNWVSKAFTIDFWGKTAMLACSFLKKGSAFSVDGELDVFERDSGQVTESGKKKYLRENSVRCRRLGLGGPTMKEIKELINANIVALRAAGRIPANVTITADDLVARAEKNQMLPYDMNAIIAAGGKYGSAKVYIKGQGFVNQGTTTVAAPATAPAAPAGAAPIADANTIAKLVAELQAAGVNLNANTAAAAAPTNINPF